MKRSKLLFLMTKPDGSNPPMAHVDSYPIEKVQRLTPRERQIALLVCTGLSNIQVAQQLNVAEGIKAPKLEWPALPLRCKFEDQYEG
jgi:Bacterial regulatory proteins, luxR family